MSLNDFSKPSFIDPEKQKKQVFHWASITFEKDQCYEFTDGAVTSYGNYTSDSSRQKLSYYTKLPEYLGKFVRKQSDTIDRHL